MKKLFVTLMIFMLAMGLFCTTAQAAPSQKTIELYINSTVYFDSGTAKTLLAAPFVDNKTDRTMVPLRMIAESMEAAVDYKAINRTVTVDKENKHLSLQLGETIWAGGQNYGTAVEKNGTTFVPVRYITEQLGADVKWDGVNNRVFVYITAKDNPEIPVNNNGNNNGNSGNNSNNDDENNTEQPEVKPYKIDTLAKVSVYNAANGKFMCQNGNTVYYIGDGSDDEIGQVNIKTGKKKALLDWRNAEIEYDNKSYSISEIYHFYYDSGRNVPVIYARLTYKDLLTGKTAEEKAFVNAKDGSIIQTGGKGLEVNTAYGYTNILGTDNDSNLIVGRVDSGTGFCEVYRCFAPRYDMASYEAGFDQSNKEFLGSSSLRRDSEYFYNYLTDGGKMYFVSSEGFYQYDNASFKRLFTLSSKPIAITDNNFYTINNDAVIKADLKGNIKDTISKYDIEVMDNRSIFGNVGNKFFVNSDDNVVLYDVNNSCFRIISENEEAVNNKN